MNFKLKKSEFDHFSDLASEWWLKNGKFKILHEIQPIRIKYIQDIINTKTLNKISILDLGCGGGLVSEGLAKLGANVTGIDFIKDNINAAKIHANKNNLKIKYKKLNFENEKINSKFDVIVIFEVLEHLSNWKYFIEKIQSNLNSNPKRAVMHFSKKRMETTKSELCIHNNEGGYSVRYINMTKDFYLNH